MIPEYLVKYLTEVKDREIVETLYNSNGNNEEKSEVKAWTQSKVLDVIEAALHITGYKFHEMSPSVLKLSLTLPSKRTRLLKPQD